MSVAATTTGTRIPGQRLVLETGEWLRGRNFDLVFILGVALLALSVGAAAVCFPSYLALFIWIDVWTLGYQHVIATYTRLCFDTQSFRAHWHLVVGLPVIVFLCAGALALGVGPWTLTSIYLYWQWFHYMRQSWGISRAYERRTGILLPADKFFSAAAIYLVPIWGILHRSSQHPTRFLGSELRTLPVPEAMVDVVGLAAILCALVWLALRAAAAARGRLPIAHTLYLVTHLLVFSVGYVVIEDLSTGWLALNVWHNAQYLLFVWLYNNNRFRAGVDSRATLLSYLSQARHAWLYVMMCLGLSTTLLLGIRGLVGGLPVALVIYQTINYHHYIVDALIWRRAKSRRPYLQERAESAPATSRLTGHVGV